MNIKFWVVVLIIVSNTVMLKLVNIRFSIAILCHSQYNTLYLFLYALDIRLSFINERKILLNCS